MSKRTLLAVLAVLIYAAATVLAGQERPWTATMLPPYGMMKDIAARDRYQFWAVGESGNILQTTDGGTIWTNVRQAQATSWLNAVSYDLSTGAIAVGNGGVIVRMLPDQEPTEQSIDANYTFTGVDAENHVAIIVGTGLNDEPLVLRSTDGGSEFAPVDVDLPEQRVVLTGVQFLSISDVVIYGSVGGSQEFGSPLIYVSHDAGRTWSAGAIAPRDMVITAVQRVAADWVAVGLQPGEESGILRTLDAGETWQFETQSDLNMITDLVRGEGLELMAFGIRVLDIVGEPTAITSEFRSTDGGRNWSIVDLSDEGTITHAARGGDKMIAVGFAQNVYSRWYDRNKMNAGITLANKHLPLGAIPVGTRQDVTFFGALRNDGVSTKRIKNIAIHGMAGVEILSPKAGDEIAPGQEASIQLAHERQEEGSAWGVLAVRFDDQVSVAMHVSSYSQIPIAEYGLQLTTDVADFGDITTTQVVLQQFEVASNVGQNNIEISGIDMEGGDLIAFGLADLPEFPITLAPGETLSVGVLFEPINKGVYASTMRIHTSTGTLYLPVSATSRQDVIDDVMDLGSVPVGEDTEFILYYQHLLWNTVFDITSVLDVNEPFKVTATTPLTMEANPYDRFTAWMTVKSEQPGYVGTLVTVPYSYGFEAVMRYDRRIVLAKIGAGDPTSVNEPIVINEPVNIYPQPASSTATVALPPNVAWTTLSLVDIQGRVLYTGDVPTGITTMDLNVSDLQPGLYSVMLRSANGVAMSPLMKN